MKLDIFNHIFPTKFYERMLAVAPGGKDMHKRVRDIPAIVDLDERFRIMDSLAVYGKGFCLGWRRGEVFGPQPLSPSPRRLPTDAMPDRYAKIPNPFPPSS